ncbi:DUF805 domain-containing protein [Knoellia sp. 3-2P3]|uniref:DUF805 domain-containing protein n=1 Tax=unclassified Knoellia TaxID=2618719 RepID=UPI0023DA2C18|nr:DUF805 domain-containing protein [Knoellia sp. 3-2P3]
MSFMTAVQTVLSKYATFSGRARRSEYWWFVLFYLIVAVVATVIDSAAGLPQTAGYGPVTMLVTLALLLPSLAVTARRLHDTGRSGWWMLLSLIPIGGLVVLIFALQDSKGPNAWGQSPKAVAAQPA